MASTNSQAARAMAEAEALLRRNEAVKAERLLLRLQQQQQQQGGAATAAAAATKGLQELLAVCSARAAAAKAGQCSGCGRVVAAAWGAAVVDWYLVLQVESHSSESAIKKRYRQLALALHPDKNKFVGAEDAFKLVKEAHGVLTDPARRVAFDVLRQRLREACPTCCTSPGTSSSGGSSTTSTSSSSRAGTGSTSQQTTANGHSPSTFFPNGGRQFAASRPFNAPGRSPSGGFQRYAGGGGGGSRGDPRARSFGGQAGTGGGTPSRPVPSSVFFSPPTPEQRKAWQAQQRQQQEQQQQKQQLQQQQQQQQQRASHDFTGARMHAAAMEDRLRTVRERAKESVSRLEREWEQKKEKWMRQFASVSSSSDGVGGDGGGDGAGDGDGNYGGGDGGGDHAGSVSGGDVGDSRTTAARTSCFEEDQEQRQVEKEEEEEDEENLFSEDSGQEGRSGEGESSSPVEGEGSETAEGSSSPSAVAAAEVAASAPASGVAVAATGAEGPQGGACGPSARARSESSGLVGDDAEHSRAQQGQCSVTAGTLKSTGNVDLPGVGDSEDCSSCSSSNSGGSKRDGSSSPGFEPACAGAGGVVGSGAAGGPSGAAGAGGSAGVLTACGGPCAESVQAAKSRSSRQESSIEDAGAVGEEAGARESCVDSLTIDEFVCLAEMDEGEDDGRAERGSPSGGKARVQGGLTEPLRQKTGTKLEVMLASDKRGDGGSDGGCFEDNVSKEGCVGGAEFVESKGHGGESRVVDAATVEADWVVVEERGVAQAMAACHSGGEGKCVPHKSQGVEQEGSREERTAAHSNSDAAEPPSVSREKGKFASACVPPSQTEGVKGTGGGTEGDRAGHPMVRLSRSSLGLEGDHPSSRPGSGTSGPGIVGATSFTLPFGDREQATTPGPGSLQVPNRLVFTAALGSTGRSCSGGSGKASRSPARGRRLSSSARGRQALQGSSGRGASVRRQLASSFPSAAASAPEGGSDCERENGGVAPKVGYDGGASAEVDSTAQGDTPEDEGSSIASARENEGADDRAAGMKARLEALRREVRAAATASLMADTSSRPRKQRASPQLQPRTAAPCPAPPCLPPLDGGDSDERASAGEGGCAQVPKKDSSMVRKPAAEAAGAQDCLEPPKPDCTRVSSVSDSAEKSAEYVQPILTAPAAGAGAAAVAEGETTAAPLASLQLTSGPPPATAKTSTEASTGSLRHSSSPVPKVPVRKVFRAGSPWRDRACRGRGQGSEVGITGPSQADVRGQGCGQGGSHGVGVTRPSGLSSSSSMKAAVSALAAAAAVREAARRAILQLQPSRRVGDSSVVA